ncbi:MAG TPA: GIY-YIG nuclease family protein [Archangium sp.]
MKPFWLYMLRCADASFYVGHTDDLERRLAEHHSGELGGYTAERLPVELVYSAEFPTREEALTREMQVKNWSRKKKEALIADDWAKVRTLARGTDRWP